MEERREAGAARSLPPKISGRDDMEANVSNGSLADSLPMRLCNAQAAVQSWATLRQSLGREHSCMSADYPMVASDYAETRRDLAKKIGLGRKPGQKTGRQKKAS